MTEVQSPILNAQDLFLTDKDELSLSSDNACNAISIGLGFDADEIQIPSTVGAAPDAGDAAACTYDAGN